MTVMEESAPFKLEELPFEIKVLEPYMSEMTLKYHHGKHHQNYVNTTNELVTGTRYAQMTLEEIIRTSHQSPADRKIFNNSAQVWNHTFFWKCLTPEANGKPKGDSARRILEKFETLENFKKEFIEKAKGLFGSGWIWLVRKENGSLSIEPLKDGLNPLVYNWIPILTCDVWEHAYYLDCQNDRGKFLENFWSIINWDFVAKNMTKLPMRPSSFQNLGNNSPISKELH
jgi:Fe-Mn family superoxide dismutase